MKSEIYTELKRFSINKEAQNCNLWYFNLYITTLMDFTLILESVLRISPQKSKSQISVHYYINGKLTKKLQCTLQIGLRVVDLQESIIQDYDEWKAWLLRMLEYFSQWIKSKLSNICLIREVFKFSDAILWMDFV